MHEQYIYIFACVCVFVEAFYEYNASSTYLSKIAVHVLQRARDGAPALE